MMMNYLLQIALVALVIGTSLGQDCTYCRGNCDVSGWCDGECEKGWKGDGCNKECSSDCLSRHCDRYDGHCLSGCIDNRQGAFCEEDCSSQGCFDTYNGCMYLDYNVQCSTYTCSLCGCQGAQCLYATADANTAAAPAFIMLIATAIARHVIA